MTRSDPDAAITQARETLRKLPDALRRTWEDRFADDWRQEAVTTRRPTPDSRPLWLEATPIQKGYEDAIEALARATRELLDNTDADPLWLPHGIVGRDREPRERGVFGSETPQRLRRTVAPGEARIACEGLSEALEWLRGEYRAENLMPPERGAILGACEQVEAAWVALPEGLRAKPRRHKHQGPCVHCRTKRPEPGRKWCGRCRKRHERGSCQACGLETVA